MFVRSAAISNDRPNPRDSEKQARAALTSANSANSADKEKNIFCCTISPADHKPHSQFVNSKRAHSQISFSAMMLHKAALHYTANMRLP